MNNIKRPLKSRRYMYVYLNVRIHLICKSGLTVDSMQKGKVDFICKNYWYTAFVICMIGFSSVNTIDHIQAWIIYVDEK